MNINEILKNDYDLLCKDYKKATKKIEKLEEDIKYYVSLKEEIRVDYENTFELMNIFKERINKAIEYIEHNSEQLEDEEMNVIYSIGDDFYLDELLDILKGSDSNE